MWSYHRKKKQNKGLVEGPSQSCGKVKQKHRKVISRENIRNLEMENIFLRTVLYPLFYLNIHNNKDKIQPFGTKCKPN